MLYLTPCRVNPQKPYGLSLAEGAFPDTTKLFGRTLTADGPRERWVGQKVNNH